MTGRMRPGLLYDESEGEEETGMPLPRRRRTDQPEEGMEFEEVSQTLCVSGLCVFFISYILRELPSMLYSVVNVGSLVLYWKGENGIV